MRYGDLCQYTHLLPPERRQKLMRLRFDSDKLLSLVAGLMIRAEIGDTPLRLNAHGKPYADGSQRFFSISHSGKCVAIAVDHREVGVDVEKLPDKDFMKLAERFYHPNELAYVKESADQARAFTRIWTRKEAYLKQLGVGITTDLTVFDTTSGALSERLASFEIEDYALSVCADDQLHEEDTYISQIELKEILK